MRWLYIGQNSEGTTSKMRADKLKVALKGWEFHVIDTHIPFFQETRLFRSLGFRFKKGPLIKKVNQYILKRLGRDPYDLIWVDKAIFIDHRTTEALQQHTARLVHFTPDSAFYDNRSTHFFNCMHLYDFLITTKTFEWDLYRDKIPENRLLLTTQGFDHTIHRPFHDFDEKDDCVAFVGRHERQREVLVRSLLDHQIRVRLAGPGWCRFVSRFTNTSLLDYQGEFASGRDYAALISSCRYGLGCLSKRFDERHTTRTFEIPACGTALLTEKNSEILSFFEENDVIYYNTISELIQKIRFYQDHPHMLANLAERGHQRVNQGRYDYQSILKGLIDKILPLEG